MSRGILEKARNAKAHENSFSVSRVVTFRRTERKEKQKYHLIRFRFQTHLNSRTVNL